MLVGQINEISSAPADQGYISFIILPVQNIEKVRLI